MRKKEMIESAKLLKEDDTNKLDFDVSWRTASLCMGGHIFHSYYCAYQSNCSYNHSTVEKAVQVPASVTSISTTKGEHCIIRCNSTSCEKSVLEFKAWLSVPIAIAYHLHYTTL